MENKDTAAQQAAKHYAPTSENLQRAFVYGWNNGHIAPGMSHYDKLAALAGRNAAHDLNSLESAHGALGQD